MKQLFLLAGVAALASVAPAYAKPDHAKGHQGHHAGYGADPLCYCRAGENDCKRERREADDTMAEHGRHCG